MYAVVITSLYLFLATILDLKTFKISNRLNFSFMIIGILLSTVLYGFYGFYHSLLGIVSLFVIMIPFWLFPSARFFGAGDVKLFMAIGALLWSYSAIYILLYSIIIACIVFLFILNPQRTYYMFKRIIYLIFLKVPLSFEKKAKKIPFAPVVLLALILINFHITLR